MTMMMQREQRLLMGVHHLGRPTSDEWARWLRLAGEAGPQGLRILVEVYGAIGPSVKQRKAFAKAVQHVGNRAAVLTDALRVRAAVTAMAWLGAPMRAFGEGRFRAAATYLELSDDELATALGVLASLRSDAGVVQAAAPVLHDLP